MKTTTLGALIATFGFGWVVLEFVKAKQWPLAAVMLVLIPFVWGVKRTLDDGAMYAQRDAARRAEDAAAANKKRYYGGMS